MATIKVHQDICNFQKKWFGLTGRQAMGLALYVAASLAAYWLFSWALGLPWMLALPVSLLLSCPALAIGFVPFYGLPAHDAIRQYIAIAKRGDVLVAKTEEIDQERSEIDRVWAKKARKRGSECGR